VSVRDEIKVYIAAHPKAEIEEIAKALAITKIEVLGHLAVINANVPPMAAPPAPAPKPEPEPVPVAETLPNEFELDVPDLDQFVAELAAGVVEPDEPEPEAPGRIHGWTASEIEALFRTKAILDIYGAAEYLNLKRNSVEYAVIRGTLKCAEIRGKKLFGRADLDAYLAGRAPGRSSKLTK